MTRRGASRALRATPGSPLSKTSSRRSFSVAYSSFASGLTQPEQFATRLERVKRAPQLVASFAVLVRRGLRLLCAGGDRLVQPAARLRRFAVQSGELDLDPADDLGGDLGGLPKLDLRGAKTDGARRPAFRGARRAGVDARPHGGFRLGGTGGCTREPVAQRLRHGDEPAQQVDVETATAWGTLDERSIGRKRDIRGPAGQCGRLFGLPQCVDGGREELLTAATLGGADDGRHAAESGDHDVRVGGAAGRLPPRRAERLPPAPRACRLRRGARWPAARPSYEARLDRRLDSVDRRVGAGRKHLESRSDPDDALERRFVEGHRTKVRDRRELCFGSLSRRGRLGRLARGRVHAGSELVRLVRQRATACVELEQDRLTGLTGEPELAARGVKSVPLYRDARPVCDIEEPIAVDEPDAVEELQRGIRPRRHVPEWPCAGNERLHRVADRGVHDEVQAPEAAVAGASENASACLASVASSADARQARAAATAFSSPGSTSSSLTTRRSPSAASARAAGATPSRSSSERSSAASRSRADQRPLGEVVALGRGRAGGCARLVRALLELGRARRAAPGVRAGGRELVREARRERRRALTTGRRSARVPRPAPRAHGWAFRPSRR